MKVRIADEQPGAEESLRRGRPTVLMRLVAGLWFGVTGFLLAVISFLVTSWISYPIQSRVFVISTVAPAAIFGLFGSIIGARIIFMPQAHSTAALAALLGAAVAALSFALLVLGVSAIETLRSSKPDLGGFVFLVWYLMALGGSLRLFPAVIIGALSGWLLYRSSRWFFN